MMQVSVERLYILAHDAFAQFDKLVVESPLVGLFIGGVYHDFFCVKVMRENPKHFRQLFNLL